MGRFGIRALLVVCVRPILIGITLPVFRVLVGRSGMLGLRSVVVLLVQTGMVILV